METEKYETFAAQVGGLTEEELNALANTPEQPPLTDEELEAMAAEEDLYRASVYLVNPHLAEARG